MLQPKKPVVKKTTKKDDGNGANDYKNMVDKSTGKKGTMGGEGTNRGPNYNMLKKNGGKVVMKKAKAGSSLKAVDASKNPGLSKLPTPVRNKMGYMKDGGKMKTGGKMAKCKYGCK